MLKSKFIKIVAGITLSFTIMASGSIILPPKMALPLLFQHHPYPEAKSLALGKRYMGVPYKFGASTSQTNRFDCSSFTKHVFKLYGINLPRRAISQSKVGKFVSRSNLKPGDLVFFYSPVHHVGIYIGHGKIIHTYGSPGVTISSINRVGGVNISRQLDAYCSSFNLYEALQSLLGW